MAKENITIGITFEYDPAEHNNMPARSFLFHFLNRFNNEQPIKEVLYKGKKFDATKTPLNDIPFKKVDSLDNKDMPKKPDWLKDRTVLDPKTNKKVADRLQKEADEKEIKK
jgi:hypothetical protein